MSKFCSYCGKELVDGQCDCQQSQNIGMQMESGAGTDGQAAAAQSDYAEMTKRHAGNLWALILNGLKRPMSAVKEAADESNHTPALLAGAVYFLVFVLLIAIRVPSVASLVLGNKLMLGIKLGLVMVFAEALVMGAVFGFARWKKQEINFMTVASVICVTTIVPSAGYLATLILSYVSLTFALVMLLAIFICWVALNYEAVKVCTKADQNIALWMTLAVVALAAIAVMLIFKSYVTNLAMGVAGAALSEGLGFL